LCVRALCVCFVCVGGEAVGMRRRGEWVGWRRAGGGGGGGGGGGAESRGRGAGVGVADWGGRSAAGVVLLGMVSGAWAHGTEVHSDSGGGGSGGDAPAQLSAVDTAKVVAIFVVFAVTLGAGMVPLAVKIAPRWLSVANMFSAGTLVAASLLHLLPASDEMYRYLAWERPGEIPEAPPADPYPIAFVLCVVGYMVTLLVDLVVVKVASGENNYMVGEGPGSPETQAPLPYGGEGEGEGEGEGDPDRQAPLTLAMDGGEADEDPEKQVPMPHGAHGGQGGERGAGKGGGRDVVRTSSVLLVGALAFHSVFEGLVVGAQREWEDVAELAGLLLVHKVLAAASLTAVFLAQGASLGEVLSASATFAGMMPVGIALGLVLYHASGAEGRETQLRVGAACDAVGAGSLLYVAIVHLMCPTFLDKKHQQSGESFIHWTSVGAGVALMASLLVFH